MPDNAVLKDCPNIIGSAVVPPTKTQTQTPSHRIFCAKGGDRVRQSLEARRGTVPLPDRAEDDVGQNFAEQWRAQQNGLCQADDVVALRDHGMAEILLAQRAAPYVQL